MTRSFRYHLALALLAGCDPAPPPPAEAGKPLELAGKVRYATSGKLQEFTWTLVSGDFGTAVRKAPPPDLQLPRELCDIEISRSEPFQESITRTVSLVYKVAGDGTRFIVVKGGVPYHVLEGADEEKAVFEALEFCKAEAAPHLFGKP